MKEVKRRYVKTGEKRKKRGGKSVRFAFFVVNFSFILTIEDIHNRRQSESSKTKQEREERNDSKRSPVPT